MIQPRTQQELLHQFQHNNGSIAQGPQKIMELEEEAASMAVSTGVYVTYQTNCHNNKRKDDCARIGPRSKCFCGCPYSKHMASRNPRKPCQSKRCKCKGFNFIPTRPEEVGDWWLTRRKGFNVNTWRCKCKCGCAHDRHDPVLRHCRDCGCGQFISNFLCIGCDGTWEDHQTMWETAQERQQHGRTVGDAFRPLAGTPGIRSHVFGGGGGNGKGKKKDKNQAPSNAKSLEQQWECGEITAQEYQRLVAAGEPVEQTNESKSTSSAMVPRHTHHRRRQVVEKTRIRSQGRPERSVRLSGPASGGTATGRVANRWGKMERR